MTIQYDSKRELLSSMIKNATVNATYLIPDLQRPYVWTPRQVILLVDSLFKGWPFGTLLLWEVKPDCYGKNEGIPHRPFWQIVDKVNPDTSTKNSQKEQPATYYMILDGQQRIQSLLLALGEEKWGFKLYNHEWAWDIHERRMRKGPHWSKATLCVDFEAFKEELALRDHKVRKIGIGQVLKWVVTDAENGQSTNRQSGNYVHPLDLSFESPGRFIRLSRLWDLAQKDLTEGDYRDLLDTFLDDQLVNSDVKNEMSQPLAEFMTNIEKVKNNSYVHSLQIGSFQTTPQWTKDDYNDAIVNIFTRLNTAGRVLTREEITLAWLKVDWLSSETDGIPAGDCLVALQEELLDLDLSLTTDELVRLISYIWAVKQRKGNLLDARDLLKGDVIRPMSKNTSSAWKDIKADAELASRHIARRRLIENISSKNAIIVFITWLHLAENWRRSHSLNVKEIDSFEKKLRLLIDRYLDRWIFGSQWSNVWAINAVQNFRAFAEQLYQTEEILRNIKTLDEAVQKLEDVFSRLIEDTQEQAVNYIENLAATDRSKVYLYRQVLWVWHRLDVERWYLSSIQMRRERERASIRLEVDHTIADAYWKRLVDTEIEKKKARIVGSVDSAEIDLNMEISPDGFETKEEAVGFINILGNCTLLEKSFNISKSANPMWDFLKDVHEFKEGKITRAKWENALSISSEMTDPNEVDFYTLIQKISERDKLMRKDLVDFINGKKQRQDID